jgi:hypothetical protein
VVVDDMVREEGRGESNWVRFQALLRLKCVSQCDGVGSELRSVLQYSTCGTRESVEWYRTTGGMTRMKV